MRRLAIILGLTAFFAGGGQALPSTGGSARAETTFAPNADAYVSSAARRRNFGRARTLSIGTLLTTRAYLRFSLAGIDAPITKATLRLYSRTGTRGFVVRASGVNWSERRITFANAPRPGRLIARAGRSRARRWIDLDVTRLAKGKRSVSLVLSGTGTTFSSRESGARRPQLVVTATPSTLIAAGDIGFCGGPWDEATAALVETIPGTVAALGDLAYENGTAAEFAACYQPSWGRFKARTRPAPGNHEYGLDPGASGYFGYWGAAAGNPAQGWYSYDLGGWHVVSLNSNCSYVGGCFAGSPQESWLRADLAAHKLACTAAYWHHPRFSGGQVTNEIELQPLWQALYDANADLVLSAHAHNYQRFAPQNALGVADPARGLREFVVGTGGNPSLQPVAPIANTEVVNNAAWGVLSLTLRNSGYDWRFLPVAGQTFTDSGSQPCH